MNLFKIIIIVFVISLAIFASTAGALEYQLLEPGVLGGTTSVKDSATFGSYMSTAFGVILGAAIVLSVLMIVIGGFEYVTAASLEGKGDGRKKIMDALTGLGIALLSWLALNTINPDLVEWKFKIDPLSYQAPISTRLIS